MNYLMDTNHAGALLRGNAALAQRLAPLEYGTVGLCQPSCGELWFMVLNSRQVAGNETKLRAMLESFAVWEYEARAARECGVIRVELKRIGRPVPAIDLLIAAIARVNDLTLLTADAHFSHVAALTVENWLVD